MEDEYIYQIDGDTPRFYVNEFFTDSICKIESYNLYHPGSDITEENIIGVGVLSESGTIEFVMNESDHDDLTFILVVTGMGGATYISEESVFLTTCTPNSAQIEP